MTQRERIIETIEGRKTDYVPFHSDLTFVSLKKLANHFGVAMEEVEDRIDNHIHYINFLPSREFKEKAVLSKRHDSGTFSSEGILDSSGNIVDEFGVSWDNEQYLNTGDWGMVDHPVKNLDFKGYIWPNGSAAGRFDGIESIINLRHGAFKTLIMTGLFDTAWHVTGFEGALMAMADPDPSVINYMLNSSLEFLVGVIQQIPGGLFDAVRLLEDWGSQKGLVMGLHNWRKHLKPRLRELYEEIHLKGLYVHSHSCGDNTDLFADLIELKADISDPLQPEVMDIKQIKDRFGYQITFMGGLPCQSAIPSGTPAEVYEVTSKIYEILSENGHYILGGAGSFPTETPVENILAIVNFYEKLKSGKGI
jgi:uroporphyrinogen decarboxylase